MKVGERWRVEFTAMAAIELTYIDEAIEELQTLRPGHRSEQSFQAWYRNTQVLLRRTFGDDSSAIRDFNAVRFSRSYMDDDEAFALGCSGAMAVLMSARKELERYGARGSRNASIERPVNLVVALCRRFPRAAARLSARHAQRAGIAIADEYDVQDVMHAFLHLHFDDVREEEWTPSYAGSSSRMDFLLKPERIVLEVKKTRAGLKTKDARDQLAIDIDRYRSHPDCSVLVCFVYDPDRYITNVTGFEADLQGQRTDKLDVHVVVAPRD